MSGGEMSGGEMSGGEMSRSRKNENLSSCYRQQEVERFRFGAENFLETRVSIRTTLFLLRSDLTQ